MADPMQGIEADVEFSFADADALKTACSNAATQIQFQQGSRTSWATTALTDFRGHYSELFRTNAQTALSDGDEVVNALRETATAIGKLADDARAEQGRRNDAREWKEQHDDRGFGGWLDDTFGDGDDCPIPEPAERMSYSPPAPPATPRQTPTGGGGTGGGTSSARPSDLHSFSTSSAGANQELSGKPGTLRSLYSAFQASCQWGDLTADGVFTGFASWLEANDNDVQWAKTVGDAFQRAGGEGAVSSLPDSALHTALQSAGVNESRQDLSIVMPSALGAPPTTGYANDPVNTATGNFIETEVDLEFTQAAGGLWWHRSYNSVHAASGAFGPGWSSWCDAGLTLDDESAAFTLPDARQITFARLGSGWDRATGENLWLARETGSEGTERLVVTGNDGTRWVHTTSGRLLSTDHGEGTTVTLQWDADRLVGLAHERGRGIALQWDGDRVVAVVASDGRRVAFDYEDGRLVAATGPLGTRCYGWDEQARIATVTDADGVVEVDNTYDEHGRVVRQRSPFGRTTRFAYLPSRITVVSDEDGTRANTWISDARGRLVGVIDAHDHRQSMAYDPHGNKVMVTDRDGGVVIRQYDARGRRVREVTPGGADVTYAHDDLDRVTRVEVSGGDPMVDAVGDQVAVTTMTYTADQRSPSTVTDPEGGVTEMTWVDGLLRRVTDPTGVSTSMDYDEHGELVATTDAEGNVARLERDATGRVVAAVTPTGHRTTYVYDRSSGMLAERVDPDGARWTYEHTAAGRLSAVVDPTGGRTAMEHGAHGEESATIDPLGRAVHRTYDDLGHVAGAELPDGSRWEFVHDALGRVTEVTDPVGGTLRNEYDVNGAPSAVTDPTGVRREVHEVAGGAAASLRVTAGAGEEASRLDVDKLGRLVSETGPDGSTRLTRYDRCARPVEVVDAVGGLTRLVRDPAGRVTTLVRPSGAETSYTYDACGRLATITDATGATSTRTYDADGRVVAQHLPTGEAATTRFDERGRVLALRVPGVGTTTYGYDAAGRVVETRDPRSGRRRFTYDAAGQLVAAIDANGGVTGYAYDQVGRCTAITHPDGGVTRRTYDGNHRVTSETDPLGRTTTAEYDASGRQVAQVDPAGSRTEWRHDESGRLAATIVDGVVQAELDRDVPGRRMRITDRSGPDGAVVVHELEWDARGLLVGRTRDGRGLSWAYDADGGCTALTRPDGTRTSYARDAVGRLVGVTHPLLGTSVVERDVAGRMVAATAGGTTQRWTYDDDGFLATHEVEGGSRTRLDHDDDGRIQAVTTDDGSGPQATAYTYDEACQLVGAVTTAATGQRALEWRYDTAGRLVAERVDGIARRLVYDAAGQLTATQVHGEDVVTYSHDAVGRRTGERSADGSARDYTWGPTGWLAAITTTDRLGDTRRTDLVVDALGELARIEGPDGRSAEVWADTANPFNGLLSVGERQVSRGGPFTGTSDAEGGSWTDPGWRDARTAGPDPWSLPTDGLPELPSPGTGFDLTATGELLVAGLEWMNRRVYDPSTRGFLSVDPLDPTTGAGWAGNPYSYAGNDPLRALDPLGLHPVTDAELRDYNATNGGFGDTAAGTWLKDNWEYVAAGAMVVGGAALMFVPGAQTIGMGLMSAGADAAIQKATTGEVNWGQVAVSGALGMVGGVGGGIAAKAGMSGWKAAAAAGAIDGAWQGGVSSSAGYLMGDGPHSVSGLMGAAGTGTLFGAGSGGALGAASHGLGNAADHLAGRNLGDVSPTPRTPDAPPAPRFPSELTTGHNAQPGVHVYQGYDTAGKDVYAGITNDMERRAAQHSGRFDIDQLTDDQGLTRGEARSVEEALIQRAGGTVREGGMYENKIHSISPNHSYHGDATAWGEHWLQSSGY